MRIQNQITTGSATTNYSFIEFNPPGYTGGVGLYGGNSTTDLVTNNYGLSINTDGAINIGCTGTGTALNVNGSIVATGTIRTGSDYRIKDEIKPLLLEEYSVDDLNPVYFKFKKDNKENIGLIAHELQEYYPFLVEGEKDGEKTQTVNYSGLIGVLIKEIQVLKKELQDLKKEIIEIKKIIIT